jgi:hypothetical protein
MIYISGVATKLVYGLFIVWLGLLAPLVYYDRFATNHFVPPYRIALFETHNRPNSLPPEAAASQLRQQLRHRLMRQLDGISASSPFTGLAHSIQWSLDQPYVSAGVTGLPLLLFGRLSLVEQLTTASADLPHPEKPPRPRLPQKGFSPPSPAGRRGPGG